MLVKLCSEPCLRYHRGAFRPNELIRESCLESKCKYLVSRALVNIDSKRNSVQLLTGDSIDVETSLENAAFTVVPWRFLHDVKVDIENIDTFQKNKISLYLSVFNEAYIMPSQIVLDINSYNCL